MSNLWQKQRKKFVREPERKVQLNLFNRFSFWEEDESEVEDEFDVKNDELTAITKNVGKQRRVLIGKNKKHRVIIKNDGKHVELFGTYPRFSIFQSLTEEDLENVINSPKLIEVKAGKIKCNRCNFKTRCSSDLARCKANGKKCNNCLKSNHFPESKNCSKTRKEKFKAKMNETNQNYRPPYGQL